LKGRQFLLRTDAVLCYNENREDHAMVGDDYVDARKKGVRAMRSAQLEGRYPYLPALDDILGKEGAGLSQINLHIREIPLDMVVGTKTKGRQNSFADNFMPLMEKETEFAAKWDRVFKYQMDVGISDPIKCYEYLKKFYVLEGNKRVSVLKYLDVPSIEAEVIRIMPEKSEDPSIVTYYEFVDFYKVCPVYIIDFSKPGSYKKFAELLGLSMTEPWSADMVKTVEASFYRFETVFNARRRREVSSMTVGDALLVYLSFYSVSSLLDQPRSVLESRIERLSEEFVSQMNQDNISLQKDPGDNAPKKEPHLLSFLFERPTPYTEDRPLKVAFLYNWKSTESAWISDMDIGRIYLEKRFDGLVKTFIYEECRSDEEITKAITSAADHGADVIVTTNPAMMPRTARAAVHYPKIRFLNMSLNLSHRSVRSYYARMYEAKFLMGAVAALKCRNHRIGYLADTPIYGNIANINAFAIGAALIDPEVSVFLEWSSLKDHDWRKNFAQDDVDIISGPDYAWFQADPAERGVFRVDEDGSILNFASPYFNWGRYYELIIKKIIDGTYDDDPSASGLQAINYWYGYSAGVIDIQLSDSLSYYSRKIIGILKKGLISGDVQPFAGEINSQNRLIQSKGSAPLNDEAIIEMDWLNDNVIGNIPAKEEMSERAQSMVSVSGVREDLQKAAKVDN